MNKSRLVIGVLFATLFLFSAAAMATSITFTTPLGATESGGNLVSAEAVFTITDGTITITLRNTLNNPTTVAQNLSDLFFTLDGDFGTAALTASSGLERNVAADGTFADLSVVAAGWAFLQAGNTFHLNDLGVGAAGPEHTIIGAPDGSNLYSNANHSIAGNDPHNPFLAGDVTFTLTIPGVSESTGIDSVVFSFGTATGNDVPGNSVPEPTSLILLGSGLLALGAYSRKRSRR